MNGIKRTFNFIHRHPLARKHLLKAYGRFISWQIRSRLKGGFLVEPFIENTKIIAKRGLTGITGNIYAGLFEFKDMGFLLHFLRKDDVFFDVGANAGSYTILAAGVRNTFCVSFEPVPATFNILRKNIMLNNLDKLVKAENYGVGKCSGHLDFTLDEDAENHVLAGFESKDNTMRISAVSLNDYSVQYEPILIKIDVEGYEQQVIAGAHNVLKNPKLCAILIELSGIGDRYGYDEKVIHTQLSGYGFSRYQYNPFDRSLDLKINTGDFNTLYIRNIDFVKRRVADADAFEVFGELI